MNEAALKAVKNEAPKLNIHQRIFEVIKSVGTVAKDGHSPEGYEHHRIDTVVAALKPHLIANGIFYTVEPLVDRCKLTSVTLQKTDRRSGELRESVQWAADGWAKVTFFNVDDPTDKLELTMWGMGVSYSDKAPAVAISYILKTLFLAVFQLRGQPDAEQGERPKSASKPRETGPACSKCGSVTYRRKGKDGGEFWGCSKYPDCKSTTPIQPVTQHKAATERLKHDTIDALEAWRDDPRSKESTIEGKGGKPISIQSVAIQILMGDQGEETAQAFLAVAKEKLGEPRK